MYNWASFVVFYILLFDSATMEWESPIFVSGTLIIVAVSMHDACRWNSTVKVLVAFLVWLLLITMLSFVYFDGETFFGGHWRFTDNTMMLFGTQISIKSSCLNACFNLQIFVAKQILTQIKERNKKKACVVHVRPKLVWAKDRQALEMQMQFG